MENSLHKGLLNLPFTIKYFYKHIICLIKAKNDSNDFQKSIRIAYLITIVMVIYLGLALRKYSYFLPGFIASK